MKIAIKRGSGLGSNKSSAGSVASAVLDAPEETYAPEVESPWHGRGPAPAGALQRGYTGEDFDSDVFAAGGVAQEEETPYVPRRGSFQWRVGGLPRSLGGRIVLGCVAFGLIAAVAVAAAGVRYFLLHDERFLMTTSADIQISGNAHLTRAQVLSVFGADLERNIFRVNLGQRRTDLERLPWVEHATVMRLLPNKIRVAITERTPVAFVRQGTQIGLVDAGGVLLDMPAESAGDPHYSFPVLTGLSADDPLSTRAARMEIYKRFTKELDGGGEKLTKTLSEVDVSNPEDVKALIESNGSDILVHFGDEEFLNRYHEFASHLAEWKQQYPKLASADMRYEGQIVLEMQTGAGVPVAGDAAANAASDIKATTTTTATANAEGAKVSAEGAKVDVKEAQAKPKDVAANGKTKVAAKPKVGPIKAALTRAANAKLAAEKAAKAKAAGANSATGVGQ